MGANRFDTVEFTVPAGTTKAAPASQLLFTQRAAVIQFSVKVPPGPSGLVGFRFDHSSAQVIPKQAGTWIVADNETIDLPLDDLSPWPDWRIRGYNTDVYAHTLYVRVYLDDRVPVTNPLPILVPIG